MHPIPGLATALVAAILLATTPCASARSAAAPGEEHATMVTLGETARREIRQDRLRLQVRIEQTGADATRVQADVNRRMAAALDRARAVAEAAAEGGVRVETGGYWIHQERIGDTREMRWRGAQALTLVGTDATAILALGARLQADGALASGLGWELSTERRRGAEDELTTEAIARLRTRASAVAGALGGSVLRFARIAIGDTGGERPPTILRAMAAPAARSGAAADPVAIAAEPGLETVQVAIQADIVVRVTP
jgi:predicted secreted protein